MTKIGWVLWIIMLVCTFIMKFANNDITFCVATTTAFLCAYGITKKGYIDD